MSGPSKAEIQSVLNNPMYQMEKPQEYKYQSLLNPSGTIKPQYQIQQQTPIAQQASYMNQLQSNLAKADPYMSAMGQRALSEGPSEWANMMEQKQRLGQTQQVEDVTNALAAERATAEAALAQRGGLSGGARERLGRDAMLQTALNRQQIGRTGQQERLGILAQDDQTKLNLMQQMPGLYGQQAQLLAGQYNTESANDLSRQQFNRNLAQQAEMAQKQFNIQDLAAKNQAASDAYNKNMATWTAMQTAKQEANIGLM